MIALIDNKSPILQLPSWLNQIECWFSILVRRLLKRGNFTFQTQQKTTLPSPEQTPSQPKSETLPSSPEQTPSQPKSETPERPTQDSTPTRPPDPPTPRVDTEKAMLVKTFTGHSDYVYSVAIAPDGKTLVSGSSDGTIKIWSLETNRELTTLTGHSGSVRSVEIAPDGKTLVSGSSDKTIKIWSLETNRNHDWGWIRSAMVPLAIEMRSGLR